MKHEIVCIGDTTNGVELRYYGNDLDEVIVYAEGKSVAHIERMDDTYFWVGLGPIGRDINLYLGATNKRSHVKFYSDES